MANNNSDINHQVPKMIYKGDWKDDMRHGFGIQDFYDGSKFEG